MADYRVSQIDEFMTRIGRQRGMSLTTGFDVEFVFDPTKTSFPTESYENNKGVIGMLCDEAQLPNVQSATGQISGRYLGEQTVQYPHSRMFTDVGLGFLCDANMLPLKFLHHWYNHIYGEGTPLISMDDFESTKAVNIRDRSRVNRLAYPDECTCSVYIMKSEPNSERANGRIPVTFVLENAYPYAVDAVPLSYGTSQITRVNVSLYYSRHTVIYGDVAANYTDGSR